MLQKNFYLIKRGKIWYTKIRDPQTREILNPLSTGQTNKTRAEQWAQLEYDKVNAMNGSSAMLLREWAERFFADGCPHISRLRDDGKHYSESTRKQNRAYVDTILLKDEIADLPLCTINKGDILDFRTRVIAMLGRTRSAQLAFGVLRIIMREAIQRDLLSVDPGANIRPGAYEKKDRIAIPMSGILAFLSLEYWPDLKYWRPTVCAALTGMRAGEVRGVQWHHINKATGLIHILANIPAHSDEVKRPKWERSRNTIYPKELQAILEPLRCTTGFVFGEGPIPLNYWKWQRAVENAAELSKQPVTLHILRHSLNTYLRGKGIADDLLRGSFGWIDSRVQDGYTHRELYDLSSVNSAVDIKLIN